MKPAGKYKLVLVTAPDMRTARRLARAALEARLIACANLLPKIESHYWWQGKIERSPEVLLLLKTTTKCLPDLEKLMVRRHPYDTPEFLVLDLRGGNEKYLRWLERSAG
jgi:periplasmic divalent cation tolerance protein